eukprot:7797633-Pyramimonas_sp.AAC.1
MVLVVRALPEVLRRQRASPRVRALERRRQAVGQRVARPTGVHLTWQFLDHDKRDGTRPRAQLQDQQAPLGRLEEASARE